MARRSAIAYAAKYFDWSEGFILDFGSIEAKERIEKELVCFQ